MFKGEILVTDFTYRRPRWELTRTNLATVLPGSVAHVGQPGGTIHIDYRQERPVAWLEQRMLKGTMPKPLALKTEYPVTTYRSGFLIAAMFGVEHSIGLTWVHYAPYREEYYREVLPGEPGV